MYQDVEYGISSLRSMEFLKAIALTQKWPLDLIAATMVSVMTVNLMMNHEQDLTSIKDT